jgi:hypothetical protein
VRIGIETRPEPNSLNVPLKVQYRTDEAASRCVFVPGVDIWEAVGVESCDPDSMWEWSPIIDLHESIPLGTTYWIQLHGFGSFEPSIWSPHIRCLRVVAFPVTSVVDETWTRVKQLYGGDTPMPGRLTR